jgi:hypothetical protein
MNITKQQLRKIIKEEKARLLAEQSSHDVMMPNKEGNRRDLEIAYYNLDDLATGIAGELPDVAEDIRNTMELIRGVHNTFGGTRL